MGKCFLHCHLKNQVKSDACKERLRNVVLPFRKEAAFFTFAYRHPLIRRNLSAGKMSMDWKMYDYLHKNFWIKLNNPPTISDVTMWNKYAREAAMGKHFEMPQDQVPSQEEAVALPQPSAEAASVQPNDEAVASLALQQPLEPASEAASAGPGEPQVSTPPPTQADEGQAKPVVQDADGNVIDDDDDWLTMITKYGIKFDDKDEYKGPLNVDNVEGASRDTRRMLDLVLSENRVRGVLHRPPKPNWDEIQQSANRKHSFNVREANNILRNAMESVNEFDFSRWTLEDPNMTFVFSPGSQRPVQPPYYKTGGEVIYAAEHSSIYNFFDAIE